MRIWLYISFLLACVHAELSQNETASLHMVKRKAYMPYIMEDREACSKKAWEGSRTIGRCMLWLPGRQVPYQVSGALNYMRDTIRKSASIINTETCLNMVEMNYLNPTKDGIIFDTGQGCYSGVGKAMYAYHQTISLGQGCNHVSTALHETLHSLGMRHEQSRPDRDGYVKVLTQFVQSSKLHNFDKSKSDEVSTVIPYDFDSVMHYGRSSFTVNGKDTLIHADPEMERKKVYFGNNEGFTHYDKKWLNWMYRCAERCSKSTCLHEGFLNKHCQCVCPTHMTGSQCQSVSTSCGRAIYINTGSNVQISSPNWPQNYANNLECAWAIRSDEDSVLEYELIDFHLESHRAQSWDKDPCAQFDYLEMRFYALPVKGPKYCGKEISKGKQWSSYYNHGMVIFKSDGQTGAKGFNLRISATKKMTCDDKPCENGGVCKMTSNDRYYCLCPSGHSGIRCQYRDGEWGSWESWSSCSGGCKMAVRKRQCDSPPPSSGQPCPGSSLETKQCDNFYGCPQRGAFYCTFDHDFCSFDFRQHHEPSVRGWVRRVKFDENGSLQGYFLYPSTEGARSGTVIQAYTPVIKAAGTRCLRFSYITPGEDVEMLCTYAYAYDPSTNLFGKQYWNLCFYDASDGWQSIGLNVNVQPPYRFIFQMKFKNVEASSAGVDDVSVSMGECPELYVPTTPKPTQPPTPKPTTQPQGPECKDDHDRCQEWMKKGECTKNSWMLKNCKKSCGICRHECFDGNPRCEEWQKQGECSKNNWMTVNCKKSCGICSPPCYDENDKCSVWASDDECEKNPTWMLLHCQQSCNLCKAIRIAMDDTVVCQDDHENCEKWALSDSDDCVSNPDYMSLKCPKSCGVCDCVDDLQNCTKWAESGECTKNAIYMKVKCRKSCGLCCADRRLQQQCCSDKDARCPQWAEDQYCDRADIGVNTSPCDKSCRRCKA